MIDFNRDRWGRPLIIPADGGKPIAYSRFSSHGQCLEDKFALEKWKLRTAARGFVNRADLFAQVAACPIDDTKRIDQLVGQALEAGGSSVGAGLGTALHEFAERIDLGDISIDDVPAPWGHDIAAYLSEITAHRLVVVPELIECRLVNDELRLAGTADRFYRRTDGRLVCADLKTGKAIGHNPLAYVVQLAAYANSVLYDIETGARTPIGDIDLTTGLIIHVPSGKAECHILEVDLHAGLEAARLATSVRTWQGKRGLVRPAEPPIEVVEEAAQRVAEAFPGTVEIADPARVEWVAERARAVLAHSAAAGDSLGRRWPVDVPTFRQTSEFTVQQLEAIISVLDSIETAHGLPFPASDPANKPVIAPVAEHATPPARINEGADVDDATITALREVVANLATERQARINNITRAAAAAGHPLSLKQKPSVRRYTIALLIVALSEYDLDIAAAIVGTQTPCTVDTIGEICGALTIDQATRIACITDAFNAGDLTLAYDAAGTPIVRGDLAAATTVAA